MRVMRLLVLCLWTVLMIHTSTAGNRPKRSLTSLFGTSTESSPVKHPVWKVHKYTGIELRPVRPDEHHSAESTDYGIYEPKETAGEPPSLLEVPDLGADNHLALAALDNLASVVCLLPGDKGQGGYLLRLFGIGSNNQQAEEKVGIVGGLVAPHIIKKKKKQIIGLAALANLLKSANVGKITGPADLQQLLGNVWDSVTSPQSVYPVQSTVYRDIPSSYPSEPSLLSRLPIIGTYFAPTGTQIKLPEPTLPHIPQLKLVPEAPKLPNLYIQGPYRVPYSTGSYVSIRVPTPPNVQELLPPSLPPAPPINEIPVTSYGIPVETPKNVYGPPTDHVYPGSVHPHYSPPAQEYGGAPEHYNLPTQEYQQFLPHNQPAAEYAPPAQEYGQSQQYAPPAQEYGQPQQYAPPAQEYGPPQQYAPPAQEYGQPQQYAPPAQEYGQSQQYAPPAQEYGPPQQYAPPAQEYGPPQQYAPPAQEYGQPQQYAPPAQEYGQPQQYAPPAQEYGPPQQYAPPAQEYGQPQQYAPPAQEYGQPQQYAPPAQEYGQPQQFVPLQPQYPQTQQHSPPPTQEYQQPVQQNQQTYYPKQHAYPAAQKKTSQDELSVSESESSATLANDWKGSNDLGQGVAVNEVSNLP